MHTVTEITQIESTYFADIVLPLYLPRLYTYRIPIELQPHIKPGVRVVVQFGAKRIYSAVVWEVHLNPPQTYDAKYILSVVDEQELVNQHQRKLWTWMSGYYLCTLGDIMKAALPAGLKLESETKICLRDGFVAHETELNDYEFLITEALEIQHELTISQVAHILDITHVYKVIRSLFEKEIIYVREELRNRYTEKKKTCLRIVPEKNNDKTLHIILNELEKKAPRQSEVLLHFLHLASTGKHIDKKQLAEAAGTGSESIIKGLIHKEIFETYTITADRIPAHMETPESFVLSEEQNVALKQIKSNYTSKEVCLLHGVTGSGKTHVYAALIEETLQKNQQVLYLVPEIALTSQMIKRLRKYFGDKVMVSHSKFNENERVEIWYKLIDKKISIIIGARSALFLPFDNLGLIIIDEEHESSYKQQEPPPRYHARDSAIWLAKIHGAKVLLGSATPAMETYFNACEGKYGLVTLNGRYGAALMPDINMADISEAKKKHTINYNFTPELLQEIKEKLFLKQQIILFQNRRGYVPILECNTCKHIPHCMHCDISLTYHKYSGMLKCHYCGYKIESTGLCLVCGSPDMISRGFGTEKIEDDLKLLIPEARISRMDLETTRSKNSHIKVISDLEEKRTDILIGTQMVSKGLDFENVTLVGVMNADQLLHFPDFRAAERSFQLLSQVSGRAGRRNIKGKVIIQTSQPEHPVLVYAAQHNYVGFYEYELTHRKKFFYPPYTRIIKIQVRSKNESIGKQAAEDLGKMLRKNLSSWVLGPEKPIISKLHDYFIMQIMIKFPREKVDFIKMKKYISDCIIQIQMEYKKVMVYADVDPV